MPPTPKPVPDGDSATPTAAAVRFPIVGIGCSAGGLDALEKLLAHVPLDSGLAFVVLQHLDPEHPSSLPELLQRVTPMPVVEATNEAVVAANCVYVVAPNKDLSLLHGMLHLLDPDKPRGHRLPIDFFLRTLAQDQKALAIGIVLSGMASDGVQGLRAIREGGGLTLAQTPETAQADSMPRSAIDAGVVDIVATAEELPGKILGYLRAPTAISPSGLETDADAPTALQKIIVLLRDHCGHDFSLYKSSALGRRIERRMGLNQIADVSRYVGFLRQNPHELDLLFRELLIGVTSFFRDPMVWDYLRDQALPALIAQYPEGKALRAWIPGCSSGEEAYSLAIVFKEAVERLKLEARFTLQIYATDLDPDAIRRARSGVYHSDVVADIGPGRLAARFVPEDGSHRIKREIRDMILFAQQNVLSDPPFTKLDILSCRNLLIYLAPEAQKKLLPLFHYALRPGGVLVLGSAETVGKFTGLFAATNQELRVFRRQDGAPKFADIEFPSRGRNPFRAGGDAAQPDRYENIGQLTDRLIQQDLAPAAVLVNEDGDILYISGHTGKYLEPAAGKVNINIHAMARPGLREALSGTLARALRDARPIQIDAVEVESQGSAQMVSLTILALDKPEPLRGKLLVVFRDIAPRRKVQRKRQSGGGAGPETTLRAELEMARSALQAAREGMQHLVEELKSDNEELQSTNEELQSANEELVSSKEELQSIAEELKTVNAETQAKVEELTWVRNDMLNLMNSTEIATLFLDRKMNLRQFTPYATKLFKLIPSDIGRPLAHVVTDLDYPKLNDDALEVLQTLIFQERAMTTKDGRWVRARIMPYRTQDNVIDGVVITFVDITAMKHLETELRQTGTMVPASDTHV